MEKISFFDILIQSWNLSFSRMRFLFFGFFMALPVATQFLLPNEFDVKTLTTVAFSFPGYTFLFLSFYFLFTLLGKSNLIYELATLHPAHIQNKTKLPSRSFFERLKKTFFLEASFGIFLFFLALILTLPSIFSFFLFEKIPELLILLGVAVFLPILIIIFFIRQFSLYYFLLSPLTFRSSCERGVALFMRHQSSIFLFGLFCFVIYGVFTFFLNLAMLGGVVLLQSFSLGFSEPHLLFLISLIFLTWYMVLSQSLWLRFFLHLAKPKATSSEVNPLVLPEQVPESPAV